jgi:hypothetical protein
MFMILLFNTFPFLFLFETLPGISRSCLPVPGVLLNEGKIDNREEKNDAECLLRVLDTVENRRQLSREKAPEYFGTAAAPGLELRPVGRRGTVRLCTGR